MCTPNITDTRTFNLHAVFGKLVFQQMTDIQRESKRDIQECPLSSVSLHEVSAKFSARFVVKATVVGLVQCQIYPAN